MQRRNNVQRRVLTDVSRWAFAATVAVFLYLVVGPPSVLAGPPFRTDDPEPVDYQHCEFYVAHTYNHDKDGRSGTAPHLELNYGVVPNVHLHIIAPGQYDTPLRGPTRYGFGDLELGVKYRFIQETETRPMVGTFPILLAPTGNQSRGLGSGEYQLLLPLWLQKSWGPWSGYGGGGYWINPGIDNKNYWYFGWQAQRAFAKWFSLGAELFYTTPTTRNGDHVLGYNIGGIVNLTEKHHVIFSAGTDIHGQNLSRYYAAYQLTWGPPEKKNGEEKK